MWLFANTNTIRRARLGARMCFRRTCPGWPHQTSSCRCPWSASCWTRTRAERLRCQGWTGWSREGCQAAEPARRCAPRTSSSPLGYSSGRRNHSSSQAAAAGCAGGTWWSAPGRGPRSASPLRRTSSASASPKSTRALPRRPSASERASRWAQRHPAGTPCRSAASEGRGTGAASPRPGARSLESGSRSRSLSPAKKKNPCKPPDADAAEADAACGGNCSLGNCRQQTDDSNNKGGKTKRKCCCCLECCLLAFFFLFVSRERKRKKKKVGEWQFSPSTYVHGRRQGGLLHAHACRGGVLWGSSERWPGHGHILVVVTSEPHRWGWGWGSGLHIVQPRRRCRRRESVKRLRVRVHHTGLPRRHNKLSNTFLLLQFQLPQEEEKSFSFFWPFFFFFSFFSNKTPLVLFEKKCVSSFDRQIGMTRSGLELEATLTRQIYKQLLKQKQAEGGPFFWLEMSA